MQIVNEQLLRNKYDVVIVGAGIGGITAGALLANKGLKVLVVEQHYLPGGVCSTVKRHGVGMDAGAALLFGWSKESLSSHTFVMNELEEEIDMIHHESIYRMHFGEGRSVTFWEDFEKYFAELVRAFPGKEEQFRGFYNEAFKIYKSMTRFPMPMSPDTIPLSIGLKMFLKHPIETMRMPKLMNGSLKDILYKYVKDKEIEGFFDLLIASCYCTTIEETPLMLAAAIVCNTHDGGAYYPSGSPQMLPNKLERALERNGGEILYRHMVEEILIRDNTAYGIKLDSGITILADKIVSDATVWNLYGKLIKSEHIPPDHLKWAQSFVPTVSAVIIYITLKAEGIPEGTQSIEAFIGDLTVLERNNYFVYIPSVDDPSIAPEGMHSISILCSAGDYDWPRPWEERYQSEEYIREKEKVAENALKAIEKRFPKFRESIVTMDIASPSTIERFTLKNYGNIGGPKQALGQHLLNRLKARSEFKNLYCVGDSTVMGEGVISATTSAVGAVNMILQDLNRKIYLPRKYKKHYVNYVKGKPRPPLPAKDAPLNETNAQRLAIECQWCENPQCMKTCPAGIDVLNFIRRLEAGNYIGAARAIREKNPLGEICGILCPAEILCEKECNRLDFSEEPTRIKDLQRWVCQKAGDSGWVATVDNSLEMSTENVKSIAIVGSGPAGLSCAYFLARLGHQVDIFEKESQFGGVLSQYLPVHRASKETLDKEFVQILSHPNIKIHTGKCLGDNIKILELLQEYNAVFLSMGLHKGQTLSIPGMDNTKVVDALNFLKNQKSSDADNVPYKIAVIGGGSVAVDAAMTAKLNGAQEVKLVCLEERSEMPCLSSEIDELEANEIAIIDSFGPMEIKNRGQSMLVCKKCIKVFDQGNFNPKFDESITTELEFDMLIMAIGQKVEDQIISHLTAELGSIFENGLIKINNETFFVEGTENVYAGGDIVRGTGTIVAAVADGRRVAIQIHKQD